MPQRFGFRFEPLLSIAQILELRSSWTTRRIQVIFLPQVLVQVFDIASALERWHYMR